MSAPLRTLIEAISARLAGSKPGLLSALVAALTVGVAAAVLTYRLLRSGS